MSSKSKKLSTLRMWLVSAAVVVLALLAAIPAFAGRTGSLVGHVLDAQKQQPLRGAVISIVGISNSGASDKHGYFTLNGIPPGTYQVHVSFVGYAAATLREVKIKTDAATHVDIELELKALRAEPIVITGERTPQQNELTSTTHYIDGKDLNFTMPVTNFLEGLRFIPGIFENHFRGGRSSAVIYLIDGIPAISGLDRSIGITVPSTAIEEVVVLPGGFSAEYGNANAGVVNIIRKRGRNRFSFSTRAYTDNIGLGTGGYDNAKQLEVGFGGPLSMSFGGPVVEMNYFISGNLSYTDTPHRESLRTAFPEPIQKNYNGSAVYDIKLSNDLNLYVQAAVSSWQWREFDGFSPDPAGTLPLRRNDRINITTGITHTVSPSFFYNLTFGYNKFRDRIDGDVLGGLGETVINSNDPVPSSAVGVTTSPWNQRAAEDNYYVTLNLLKQLTSRIQLKIGGSAEYYDVSLDGQKYVIQPFPSRKEEDFAYSYSLFANDFRRYPYAAAGYAESRIVMPGGIIGQFGVRLDHFGPNTTMPLPTLVDDALVPLERKVDSKTSISPRIGLSIPVGERENFYFNYGRYAQLPSLFQLYAGAGTDQPPQWPLLGNPDLELTHSTSTEVSYNKTLDNGTHFQITGFYIEYENLVDTDIVAEQRNGEQLTQASQYVNRAYGRAKGLEIQASHAFGKRLSGRLGYAYMHSTGTANNPEETYFEYVRRGIPQHPNESELNWDQRHSVIAALFADLQPFQLTIASRLYSPRQWFAQTTTQTFRDTPPFRSLVDLKMRYQSQLGRYQLTPFVEIRNLFNIQYREPINDSLFFSDTPITSAQDHFGRRIKFGVQIN